MNLYLSLPRLGNSYEVGFPPFLALSLFGHIQRAAQQSSHCVACMRMRIIADKNFQLLSEVIFVLEFIFFYTRWLMVQHWTISLKYYSMNARYVTICWISESSQLLHHIGSRMIDSLCRALGDPSHLSWNRDAAGRSTHAAGIISPS